MKRFEVFLSPIADFKLDLLLNFLELEWGSKAKKDFLDKFIKSVRQISTAPESCVKSKEFIGLYRCVVSKQTSIYYRILKNSREIEIVTVVDNRQDLENIAKEIKNHFG